MGSTNSAAENFTWRLFHPGRLIVQRHSLVLSKMLCENHIQVFVWQKWITDIICFPNVSPKPSLYLFLCHVIPLNLGSDAFPHSKGYQLCFKPHDAKFKNRAGLFGCLKAKDATCTSWVEPRMLNVLKLGVLNNKVLCVCACSVMSDSVTPWTVTCQTHLSVGFPRQEY